MPQTIHCYFGGHCHGSIKETPTGALLSTSDFLVQKVCSLHASVARLKLYVREPGITTGLHVAKNFGVRLVLSLGSGNKARSLRNNAGSGNKDSGSSIGREI
ncbi:hypothetical protein KL928_004240 [Ogataea angusta]|uniref:Uncharacterized protein n=1 Tax=Pichia angusta TaxID=870730 RepID=A0AAN6DDB8_PICAN|nr:uncharacterized protein KL928_004240 [Ogataea angusta]KAG7816776.1 hypothetical protein KL928_004240 [Ogataea angusta]